MRIQPDQTPQPSPDAGIFNPNNPPQPIPGRKAIFAIVIQNEEDDVVAYYSRYAGSHLDVLHEFEISAHDSSIKIIDGGYINHEGRYVSDRTSQYSRNTTLADQPIIESLVNRTYKLKSEFTPHEIIPDRGIFKPDEFPEKYLEWRIPAVKRSDGAIIWSAKAYDHAQVLEDNRDLVEGEHIIEGGIIEKGVYTPSETSFFTHK